MKAILILILLVPNTLGFSYINFKPVTKLYELVTLTTYTASANQTDSTPHITASGFIIDTLNPKKHKIIAVSRDLKKKWKFGTRVKILNAGRYNGIYYVKDLMNKRYKNRVDILINADDKQTKLLNVKIFKL
jgi:3D (Asp-Asp-Asp) domain-containing protein